MNRRRLAVAVVVAIMTASAHAGDPARNQEIALPQAERPLRIRALFERAPGVISENANGITAGPSQVDVIVARIGTDGKLVKACVDSEAAARRFLEAPIEKVEGRKAKEH
jgi:hypothetical protein